MTTIKQVPASLLQALGLHKGDLLTVMDESPSAFVIEITSAPARDTLPSSQDDSRRAALARFSVGAHVEHPSTETELDDARFEALRAKHLK